MAKKSFKGGMGDLLQESIDNNNNAENGDNDKIAWLEKQVERKDNELRKWRTGQLTVEIFNKTLAENNLKYNPKTNSFEKI